MGSVPLVSIVIPVYNQVDLLERCLESLDRQEGVTLETIVVSDASPQDPGPVVERHPRVRLVRSPRNVGYAAANNLGLEQATGEFILFLNSDTELPPDTLARMVAYLREHPDAGGVAPVHREPTGAVQRTCFGFPTLRLGFLWDSVIHRLKPEHPAIRAYTMADWDFASDRWVEHAQTSCLLVRREVYDQIGGMDPKLFLFYNDTDFCFRMHRAGHRTRFLADLEILHHGGASVATFERADAQIYGDRFRYYRKWFGWRGALAVRTALWSRVGYETLVELAHGDFRFAMRKVRRGLQLNSALSA
jgi:GT2 family glycosyltransferase